MLRFVVLVPVAYDDDDDEDDCCVGWNIPVATGDTTLTFIIYSFGYQT